MDAIRDAATPQITEQELSYFTTSSVHRAKALANLARRLPMQPGGIVEHGCALGVMSLCLMKGFPQLFAEAHGSEIKPSFVETGRRLWRKFFDEERLFYQATRAESFVYPQDVSLILFAQVLCKLSEPGRKAIVAKAIEALNPGGFLIVNEILGELVGVVGHEISIGEMRELLPGMEMPYTPHDGFLKKDKRRWPPDTFFVYRKLL